MRAIEAQDEELAMVMQEQEKLKVAKRQAKIAAKRQLSQPVYPEVFSLTDGDNIVELTSERNI